MNEEDQEERQRVAFAKAMKKVEDGWAQELRFIALRCRIAHARYVALLKAGFTEQQALELCVRNVEL